MANKILFLVPYPLGRSPSQRFRFEQYFGVLRKNGFKFRVTSFLDDSNWQTFTTRGNFLTKTAALFKGIVKRLSDLIHVPFYDFVFIHREASPIGPPLLEWFIRFVFRKKIIYDFDDAIWLTDKEDQTLVENLLKWRSKVKRICRWSFKVSCANQYLFDFASMNNNNVVRMPTTVDAATVHNRELYPSRIPDSSVVIGWTGSYSTLKYLKALENIIAEIESEFPQVTFLVIADRPPSLSLPSLQFVQWDRDTEIQDLLRIDIGVMPLPDDPWTRGKSAFKCVQYLALEIPAVASSVGVNSQIIDHGVNGFLAQTPEDWKQYLITLINDRGLREKMGRAGREKVLQNYSVAANTPTFLSLFRFR